MLCEQASHWSALVWSKEVTVHCIFKMAARDDLPNLSADETFMFLDLWEGFPCLCNLKDHDYKNMGEKHTWGQKRTSISACLSKLNINPVEGWSTAQQGIRTKSCVGKGEQAQTGACWVTARSSLVELGSVC